MENEQRSEIWRGRAQIGATVKNCETGMSQC